MAQVSSRLRVGTVSTVCALGLVYSGVSASWAQGNVVAPPAVPAPAAAEPAPVPSVPSPAPAPAPTPAPAPAPAPPAPDLAAPAPPDMPPPMLLANADLGGLNQPAYGAALRTRWISAPSWFLGLFTKKNVPLSTYGAGVEFFRRKGEMDVVLGFSYQKMGPPDGNWLGKGHDASIDTDLVQFRNFGFVGTDIAFVWHNRFNDYFGMHYGAGLGLAFITGKILRTSADHCTEANAGDRSKCYPDGPKALCPGGVCTEAGLAGSEGDVDNGPSAPHRFKDKDVPGAIPILNMLAGLNLRFPEVKGFEVRLEGGFYNAFFAGLGVAQVF